MRRVPEGAVVLCDSLITRLGEALPSLPDDRRSSYISSSGHDAEPLRREFRMFDLMKAIRPRVEGGSDRSVDEIQPLLEEVRELAFVGPHFLAGDIDRLYSLFQESDAREQQPTDDTALAVRQAAALEASKPQSRLPVVYRARDEARRIATSAAVGGAAASAGAVGSAFLLGGYTGAVVSLKLFLGALVNGIIAGTVKGWIDRPKRKL